MTAIRMRALNEGDQDATLAALEEALDLAMVNAIGLNHSVFSVACLLALGAEDVIMDP